MSRNFIQHTVDEIHLCLVVLQVLTQNLLGNLDTERSYLLADIGNGGFLLLLDGHTGIFQKTGTFLTSFVLSFLYDGIAGVGSLFQNLSLLLASLLEDGFTFFLYIGQSLVGLMRLAQ